MNHIEFGLTEDQYNQTGGSKMGNSWDLKGYQREKIKDDFEMMKGKGHICQVNSALIEDMPAGTSQRDGKEYEGYKRFGYELEVISETYKGRRVWKRYNLDSDEARGKEGKEKTPREKLADIMFTVGLEFNSIDELQEILGAFANMKLSVSFGSIPADRSSSGKDQQFHRIMGIATEEDVSKGNKEPF